MESSHTGHERLRQVERWRYRTISSLAEIAKQSPFESNQKNFDSLTIQEIYTFTNKESPLVQEEV